MLKRKLFRTILQYKAQFISMIIMITIVVGIFVGFNIEWKSIEYNTKNYYEETNFADYKVYTDSYFSDEDITKIKEIPNLEATRWLSVDTTYNTTKGLALSVIENYDVSKLHISSGQEYNESQEGFYLSDQFAKKNNIKIGDLMTINYKGIFITSKVLSLVKSSEFLICTKDTNQLMPDYNNYGYAFITPSFYQSALGSIQYNQINILSNMSKTEIEDELFNKLNKTLLVIPKEDSLIYTSVQGEIDEGKTMGYILPVLFLSIAILTMCTTMHRIAINEKKQIGTMKALGFRNRKILIHYSSLGLYIGIIGCILGVALGYGIAFYILNPNGTMMSSYFDLPKWTLIMPWYCYLIVVMVLFFLVLISFISIKKLLKGNTAEVLKTYTPKNMKKLKVENLKIWDKLSFKGRWNLRDILRHKSRAIMTLIGIVGCMLLLICGFGMKDTMSSFLDKLIETTNYNTKINLAEDSNNAEALELSNKYHGDWSSTTSIKVNDENIVLDIYHLENDLLKFIDDKDKPINIENNGVYICKRLLDDGIKIGDEITIYPYGTELSYKVKVNGVFRSSFSKSILMTDQYANSISFDYKINSIYTNEIKDNIEDNSIITSIQDKDYLINSYDYFLEIMNTMVLVLVLAAIVLGIVVLYNLGVMSYMERYRELATLKVIGFKNRHISSILISQNIWLSIIGIIIGIPFGVLVLKIILLSLGSEYELKLHLGFLTYFASVLLTIGVSLFVGYLVSRKNKKIDMVEALKGTE